MMRSDYDDVSYTYCHMHFEGILVALQGVDTLIRDGPGCISVLGQR